MGVLIREDGFNKSVTRVFKSYEITRGDIIDEIAHEYLYGGGGYNGATEITEDDINELRKGKVIRCDNGGSAEFLAMRVKPERINDDRKGFVRSEEIPTPEEAREHILCLQKIDSTPERHEAMDDYLMTILEKLGYKKAVDVFNNTDKWYA